MNEAISMLKLTLIAAALGGADMDNLMRPRKAICFDYSNGTNFLVEG